MSNSVAMPRIPEIRADLEMTGEVGEARKFE